MPDIQIHIQIVEHWYRFLKWEAKIEEKKHSLTRAIEDVKYGWKAEVDVCLSVKFRVQALTEK